jgi:hypothetical protein
MCFYINSEHQKVKIATEDIICYKLLDNDIIDNSIIISPYQYSIYFNSGNTHPVIKRVDAFSFSKYNSKEIERGLHSYSSLDMAKKYSQFGYSIHKAIIPKGTQYYYNPAHNEYVSLKLKVWKKNLR